MTVADDYAPAIFTGNGATTVFPYTFNMVDEDFIRVTRYTIADGEVQELTLDTDFSITNVGEEGGGDVTFPLGSSIFPTLTSSYRIVIERLVPYEQDVEVQGQGTLNVEDALDKLARQVQQLAAALDRVPQLTAGDTRDPDDVYG